MLPPVAGEQSARHPLDLALRDDVRGVPERRGHAASHLVLEESGVVEP